MLSPNKILIALFSAVLILSGCGAPISKGDLRFTGSTQEQRAERLANKGDYGGAAFLYERIARNQTGARRTRSLLTAADYYLSANDVRSSRRVLQALGQISAAQFPLYPVVNADLLLRDGKPSAALSALGGAPVTGDGYTNYRYYSTLARIHMARDNEVAALRAMLKLDGLGVPQSYRLSNQRALLGLLSSMTISKRQQYMNDSNRNLAGWAMLADILEHSTSLTERNSRLAGWKASFRSHPALRELYEGDAAQSESVAGSIAVLLPTSGVYAKAANAIRNGIEATHAQLPPERQPALTFIDSTSYATALSQAETADMVIGPLTKTSVQEVITGGGVGKTTITLNQVSDYSPSGTYQFGLSTVAEGAMIADKAWQDGLRDAAVIYPNASWGARYLQGFRNQWESLGGTMASVVSYELGTKSFSAKMKTLMNENSDFVFIVAKPLTARQIRQQVRYFGSAQTAVYASSSAYDRRLYGVQDRDFDGVKVPVLRWTVPGQDVPDVPSWSNVKAAGDFNPGLAKFYALGIDALLVAINQGRLSAGDMIRGATGDLSISGNGIVERNMIWLHYQGGVPVPISHLE